MDGETRYRTQTKLSAMSSLNVVLEKRERMFSPEYMMNPLPVALSLQPGCGKHLDEKTGRLPDKAATKRFPIRHEHWQIISRMF